MMTLLIGHRGVGKTSLLESLRARLPLDTYDLDREIERTTGQSIADIFAYRGEADFRALEKQALDSLITSLSAAGRSAVISVGAGFLGPRPQGVRVVWVRRASDADGRIFLNRPRLNKNVSPLIEYVQRFEERESRYRQMADEVLQLPEGYEGGLEAFFAEGSKWNLEADLTLFPHHLRDDFINRRLSWGVRRFEVRTDLLTAQQREWLSSRLSKDQMIYSIRHSGDALPEGVLVDWALELGEPPARAGIISLHERGESFAGALERLSRYPGILKLAVEVSSFEELRLGHEWWLKDPARRSFLPRSLTGRWQWYRSLFGPQMPLHYIRESEGSALDQPFLWQTVMRTPLPGAPVNAKGVARSAPFAAVLGSPIHHSRTPLEHREFFAAAQIPVVAIEVGESEWSAAFHVLEKLGLKFAAVTSPLKERAFMSCETATDVASVNTLVRTENRWLGVNTDVEGLRALESEVTGSVALWGGGGTLAAVRKVFGNLAAFSARTGQAREGSTADVIPGTLLWAVGRGREFQWPPENFPQRKIIDLNYTADSPGLELAVTRGLSYVSGLKMFRAQAEGQRAFWRRFL